jgi:hypothetical protein
MHNVPSCINIKIFAQKDRMWRLTRSFPHPLEQSRISLSSYMDRSALREVLSKLHDEIIVGKKMDVEAWARKRQAEWHGLACVLSPSTRQCSAR